jgi:hypothetical protein
VRSPVSNGSWSGEVDGVTPAVGDPVDGGCANAPNRGAVFCGFYTISRVILEGRLERVEGTRHQRTWLKARV